MTDPTGIATAWVSINLGNLVANAKVLRAHVEKTAAVDVGLLVMVKADAYGCGARLVVKALEDNLIPPPWGYGVATVEEGIALRKADIQKPIIVFSPAAAYNMAAYDHWKLHAVIDDPRVAAMWTQGLGFHLEINTGLNRNGIRWDDAPALARCAAQHCDGAFTHLSAAESYDALTKQQIERFEQALTHLEPLPTWLHIMNSAGIWLATPPRYCNLVRPGSFLYGGRAADGMPTPRPVMTVRARVVSVRDVPAGETVGYYKQSWVAQHSCRVATLGIGYADGVPQCMGGQGFVLLHGVEHRILHVSQDFTMISLESDVLNSPTRTGVVATLIGVQGRNEITVNEFARWGNTVVDDVLTRLGTSRVVIYNHMEAV